MKLYKRIFYSIKHIIPIVGLAGTNMLSTACARTDTLDDNFPSKRPVVQHDVEFDFNSATITKTLSFDTLQKCIDDETVRTIYIVPIKHWNNYKSRDIVTLRDSILQPRLDMSPKIRGVGDFDFELGQASLVKSDSIWFVQSGWTINKDYQR